ncbi:cupin domain-containing protein [Lonsdalea quercina]|uniref:hypothetical protein n=2 Tax=Lonsdalea quercina TaxID=71657 RepID=UPI003976E94A
MSTKEIFPYAGSSFVNTFSPQLVMKNTYSEASDKVTAELSAGDRAGTVMNIPFQWESLPVDDSLIDGQEDDKSTGIHRDNVVKKKLTCVLHDGGWQLLHNEGGNMLRHWIYNRRHLFPLLLVAGLSQAQASDIRNTIPYWSVWVDKAGISHQAKCQLDTLKLEQFSAKGDPEWVSQEDLLTSRYVFNIMPVGWVGPWHKNPSPQWIIPLSGRWFVQTMDGKRVEMGPGEISFGYDKNAGTFGNKVGHMSGAVGKEPAKVMVVQVTSALENPKDERCPAGGVGQ